jgi:hypothetical protein
MMRITALLLVALTVAVPGMPQESQLVNVGENNFGVVWANIQLTRMRVSEPYLPMVIGIQNASSESVRIDRDAIRLVGPDGRRYPVAGLKEVRKEYDRLNLDRRIANANGIPWEVWYRQRRLQESNFFPGVMNRRGTVIDQVVLRRQDGMVDLVYFPTPRGLALNTPFALEIAPEGWEAPLQIRLRLE